MREGEGPAGKTVAVVRSSRQTRVARALPGPCVTADSLDIVGTDAAERDSLSNSDTNATT
jgi:hypothetical protein